MTRNKTEKRSTPLKKRIGTPRRAETILKEVRYVEPAEEDYYKCCTCGVKYKKQSGNFSYSQSPLYRGNNSFLPICNDCLENIVNQYTELLGNQNEAIKRVCLHWDIYVSDSLLNSTKKIEAGRSRIKCYVKNCNLNPNCGKTYDTYLKETNSDAIISTDDVDEAKTNGELKVAKKTINFFGLGFTAEQYKFLQDQYDDWVHRHECRTKSQEEVFKNLCIAQLNIQIAQQTGGKVKDAMDSFQNLLGTANLKPCQTNENALADQNTFGTLIKKWENEKPIAEPEPEWKDVDGIARYIHIYFLGHLCKMMGIKNSYSRMYDEEMNKYRVEKPEYEGDDEALFDAVFNSKSSKDDEDDS